MKALLYILVTLSAISSYSQNKEPLFVPLKISYFPGFKYRIPWEEELDKSTWINVLTYPLTNPKDSRALYSTNKAEYNKLASKMLYTKNGCDSLVKDYVKRITTKFSYIKQYGKGGYYEQEKSGDRMYRRCVCFPASELKDLGHGDAMVVGTPIKYIEPKDFVAKFKRYKLDSLDLTEAPYYTIFPMDIDPSFDCSKASNPIEKAICRDAKLANLDKQLMEAYKEALKAKGERVKTSQREWLQERYKKCEGKGNEEVTKILEELYCNRIEELKD